MNIAIPISFALCSVNFFVVELGEQGKEVKVAYMDKIY